MYTFLKGLSLPLHAQATSIVVTVAVVAVAVFAVIGTTVIGVGAIVATFIAIFIIGRSITLVAFRVFAICTCHFGVHVGQSTLVVSGVLL